MTYRYRTRGTCARGITFDIDPAGRVCNVKFEGGCSGNTQGVARLVEGMDANEAVRRLSGIRCGVKSTSCPDQLATAIQEALNEQ